MERRYVAPDAPNASAGGRLPPDQQSRAIVHRVWNLRAGCVLLGYPALTDGGWMDPKELKQAARIIYAKMPEAMRDSLLQIAWDVTRQVCEKNGTEATPEFVAGVLDEVLAKMLEPTVAKVSEIATEEELRRVQEEEYKRLGIGGRAVSDADLAYAMSKRLLADHAYLFRPPAS